LGIGQLEGCEMKDDLHEYAEGKAFSTLNLYMKDDLPLATSDWHERAEDKGSQMKREKMTELELQALARRLEELDRLGYKLRIAFKCGQEGHRHSYRFTAWLCSMLSSIYIFP
jgi:hypothetical protein